MSYKLARPRSIIRNTPSSASPPLSAEDAAASSSSSSLPVSSPPRRRAAKRRPTTTTRLPTVVESESDATDIGPPIPLVLFDLIAHHHQTRGSKLRPTTVPNGSIQNGRPSVPLSSLTMLPSPTVVNELSSTRRLWQPRAQTTHPHQRGRGKDVGSRRSSNNDNNRTAANNHTSSNMTTTRTTPPPPFHILRRPNAMVSVPTADQSFINLPSATLVCIDAELGNYPLIPAAQAWCVVPDNSDVSSSSETEDEQQDVPENLTTSSFLSLGELDGSCDQDNSSSNNSNNSSSSGHNDDSSSLSQESATSSSSATVATKAINHVAKKQELKLGEDEDEDEEEEGESVEEEDEAVQNDKRVPELTTASSTAPIGRVYKSRPIGLKPRPPFFAAGCITEASIFESPARSSSNSTHWPEPYLLVLGRQYLFLRAFQHGEGASVYRAMDRISGERVVLKIATNSWDGHGVPKEVRLLNRIQGHPNICHMVGWHAFATLGTYAIVTQDLPNDPLESVFAGGDDVRRNYMKCLLAGIGHMHQRGVLFRDVKPHNFLWSAKTQTGKFIDLDCSTFFDAQDLHRSMVGTKEYYAPEIVEIKKCKRSRGTIPLPFKGYGRAVDVYAAGVVLARLIFEETEDQLHTGVARGPEYAERADVLREKRRKVKSSSVTECDLLLQLLRADPEQRITASQALQHPWFSMQCTE